jgi:hypothetical protein
MPETPQKPKSQKLPPLRISQELKTEYVNLVRIAHTASEMVFDFAHLLPGGGPAQASSRIIMSPLGAKLFFRALSENLTKYEKNFGEIRVPGDVSLADHLFKAPDSKDKSTET